MPGEIFRNHFDGLLITTQQCILELQPLYIHLAVYRHFIGGLQSIDDFGLQGNLLVELKEFPSLLVHGSLPDGLNGVSLILGASHGCAVNLIGQERVANVRLR